MSNVTDAIGNLFSGGGGNNSGGSSPLGNILGSLGTALSGIGGAASQTGGTDPNTGQPIADSGGASAVQSADTSQAATDLVNPSQSAQAAITAGQNAPTQNQNQNPQGPNQQGGQNQGYAPEDAVQQLAKALQQAQRRGRQQNPYQTGGGQGAAAPLPATPYPEGPSNQPEYGPGLRPGGPDYESEGESNQPEYGPGRPGAPYPEGPNYQPEHGHELNLPGPGGVARLPAPGGPTSAGQLVTRGNTLPAVRPVAGGAGGPPGTPETSFNDYLDNLRQSMGIPKGGYGSGATLDTGGGDLTPSLGGLARTMGLSPAGIGLGIAMKPTPAETGEFTPAEPNFVRPDAPPATKTPDIPRGMPGREDQQIDPRTGKPFDPPTDPKTGKKLPTKKGPLPTKVPTKKDGSPDERFAPGHYVPTPGIGRGPGTWVPGSMMRDVQGGQSIPPLLGEIAQMALPLLMGGLMGGFGGGGRRGIRGFGMYRGGGRHFGGGGPFEGHWPYHHPQHGWDLHGDHPGQGWRPMDPRHFRHLMGGGYGNRPLGFAGGQGRSLTGNPQLDQWLSSLGLDGGDGQNQGRGENQVGFGNEASYDPYYDKGTRYRQPGEPSASVTGKGPNGQALPYTGQQAAQFTNQVASQLGMDPTIASRILAGESSYGQNYTNNRERDGIPSYGPFQLHDSGPGSVGHAFKQATGEDPSDPSTWQDQIVFALKWAQANGWTAWGAARDAGISRWAGITGGGKVPAFAWDYGGHAGGGRTATGGTMSPNPTGNAPVQVSTAGGLPVMSDQPQVATQ